MRWRLAVFLLLLAAPSHATVWQRARPDGTLEFTNVPRSGGAWKMIGDGRPARPLPMVASAPVAPALGPMGPAAPVHVARPSSTFWTRSNPDGTVEFTNLPPVGARWKVLFRTGPGKAASERGDSDLVPPRDLSQARFARFDDHIRDQQAFYGVPQALIRAIIKTESDFDPHVVSSVGAMGLMQLMPDTARGMGVTDVWDPRQNIMGGARYLQLLAQRFCKTPAVGAEGPSGTLLCSLEEKVKVLAGYHAGPGAVEKYGGLPPYETTRSYVMTVLGRFENYRKRDAVLSGSAMVAAR